MSPLLAKLDAERFGPWALVTGASSGIGREFARQIAANGINVVLVARRLKLLEEAGRSFVRDYGVAYRAVSADLSQDGFLAALAEATRGLDIGLVVSNAGTANPGEFLKQDPQESVRLFKLNAQAHLEVCRHFAPGLAARGRGGIVLTGAMGAARGVPYVVNDSASKAYVQTLGVGLNYELAPLGIDVTVLVVGPTQTAIIEKFGLDPKSMPMKPMSVEQCVFEGLGALKRNRPTFINGRMNRMMDALMPTGLAKRMMKGMMEKGLAARGIL
jgi:uncharacterized protein